MNFQKLILAFLVSLPALSLVSCGEIYYTVRFLNDDGGLLFQNKAVVSAAVPEYEGNTPVKANTNQYTYAFKGWDKPIAACTGNVDYTAIYTSTVNQYTVTFLNYDDSFLANVGVPYDGTAVYPEVAGEPVQPGNDQYTYAFKGWNQSLEHIVSNVTRKAIFTPTTRSYTVTYVNYDGSRLDSQNIEYGKNANYDKVTPAKTSDDSFDYAFSGWDLPETNIVKDVTLTAQFVPSRNSFQVKFLNEDGTLLDEIIVAKGTAPVYAKAVPSKASDDQYDYTFKGWDRPLDSVFSDSVFHATYTPSLRFFNVVYQNYDGTQLDSQSVKYGQNSHYTKDGPIKPMDELHTFTFTGWNYPETNIVKDMTLTAVFVDVLKQYQATFYDGDGRLVYTEAVDADTSAVYLGSTPTKSSTESKNFVFSGWDKSLDNIRSDTAFYAQFTDEPKAFHVSFKNEDGTLLKTESVKYGETVSYTGDVPTKAKTAQYSYAFSTWDKPLVNITNDCDRYAIYTSSINSYSVKFVGYDGTVLQTDTINYGSAASYKGTKPIKPADDDYGFIFTGWDQETSSIVGDTTFTAQFTKTDYFDYVLSASETSYVVYPKTGATIPAKAAVPESYKNLPVSKIGDNTFNCCTSLVSIDIPSSVSAIGKGAFLGCSSLSSVEIPSSVTSIGDSAFAGCSFSSLTLPSSVLTLGTYAFSGCGSLTSIFLSSSITSLSQNMFEGCSSLLSIAIPSSVASLGNRAFSNCTSLVSVEFSSSSLASIGDEAFFHCTSLAHIDFPSSLTTIYDRAFGSCPSLTSLYLPSSLTFLGEIAFFGCSGLTSVTYGGTQAALSASLRAGTVADVFASSRIQYILCSDGKLVL